MTKATASTYPDVARVRQDLHRQAIGDVPHAVRSALAPLAIEALTRPGETVAVAVGSRGISAIDAVVGGCIEFLRARRLEPFIVPAMGSHGGATAEGQRDVLQKLGISQARLGVPIAPDMAVDCIDRLANGTRIFFSRQALAADHIVVINRVKPHTKFRADIESGLCKMLTIGLGKADGATEFHRQAIRHSFGIIEDAARLVLGRCRVLFALALLEDGYGDLALVKALLPADILTGEKELLKTALDMLGRIPFDDIDILVVDRFGKDISGIGMDSNVTGRHRDLVGDFFSAPHVKRIFVRDLSSGSDGNGNGIGLADVTTRRLVDALDLEKTYRNSVTAISPEKAAIPLTVESDREAIAICAATAGLANPSAARLVRILDTKHLEVVQVSAALAKEVHAHRNLHQESAWAPMEFDHQGNLPPFAAIRSGR
ncbi:MAG: DUF362 domain-containing protein [Desulfobacterales bacterium]